MSIKPTLVLHNVWYEKCFKFSGGSRASPSRLKVMQRFSKSISVFAAVCIAVLAFIGTGQAQQRVNTREVREIIRDLNLKIADFQSKLSYQLESSSADQQTADMVNADLRDMQARMRGFDQDVVARRDNRDSLNDILDLAANVDSFMRMNRQNRGLENNWSAIRTQLDRLSANYGITRNWTTNASQNDDRYQPYNAPQPAYSDSALTGTFRIDVARSERVADVLSGSSVSAAQRREIEEKLDAPEQVAIYVDGQQVTLASSKASPVSFKADGSERTENANGRTVKVRSNLSGDKLSVARISAETDYTTTFETTDGGKTLKVTRRITTDYLPETVFAESFYTRTSTTATLGIRVEPRVEQNDTGGGYSSNDPNDVQVPAPAPRRNPQPQTYPGNQYPSRQRVGEFIVPNGTVLVGTLEGNIDTKVSQNNDRFRMIVQTPTQFRGAVVEGHLSGVDRSGRVLGRTVVTFNFDRITMPDGSAYDFAGTLQRLVDQSGRVIPVDAEGTVRGKDKNRDTATRGGIGAGIGAIIGAIAGGGSGAAVGAMIGGGVGAGSVYMEGGGDMQLSRGASMTVQSSSPLR